MSEQSVLTQPVIPPGAETPPELKRKKQVSLKLPVPFTQDELLAKGSLVAEHHRELEQEEADFKQLKEAHKTKVSRIEAQIKEVLGHLALKSEYRDVVCTLRFDDPVVGKKTTYRNDTLEQVSIEAMTLLDIQTELPLNDKKTADKSDRKTAGLTGPGGEVITPGDKGEAGAGEEQEEEEETDSEGRYRGDVGFDETTSSKRSQESLEADPGN